MQDFLEGLLTDKEREELGRRLEIIKRLKKHQPQYQISSELGVGIATVTRGAKELRNGKFRVLDVMEKEKK